MAKRFICIEETNQHINEFSIGYITNPNLNTNKAFREQVKVGLKSTFGPSTNTHIGKTLLKDNTRVLALVMFYENRKTKSREMFRVLSCVIYTIISKYVFIKYVGSEKSKLSYLRPDVSGRYKHLDKDYDNVLGFGIPDLLLNLLSCKCFSKNNEYVAILKCPHRMSEYYFNKGFIIFDCDEENLKRLPSQVKNRIGTEVTIN